MKQYVIPLLLLACLLVGCTAAPQVQNTTAPSQTDASTAPSSTPPATSAAPTTTTQPAPTAPPISPDTVGIYIPADNGTRARTRVTEFAAKRTAKKDIDCFEILATRETFVQGASFAAIWKAAWDAHPDAEHTKIGFRITFSLTDGETVSRQLLKPSDSRDFYEYLEIYLYDDVHVTPGVWYTHLEDKDMKEDTVITSIKLTSGSRIDQVGDIHLTAFLYTGDSCFDAHGNYIGAVAETIVIRNIPS